jgi:hypothetical protein
MVGIVFSVERREIMIKDEKQRTTRRGSQLNGSVNNGPNTRFTRTRRSFFLAVFKPMRRGVSQQVLNIADQVIEEYKSDLDYLKDK